jgi:hypothetical protein
VVRSRNPVPPSVISIQLRSELTLTDTKIPSARSPLADVLSSACGTPPPCHLDVRQPLKRWCGPLCGADRHTHTGLWKHCLCSIVPRCSERLKYTMPSEAALYPFGQHTWITRAYELPPIVAYSQYDRQHYGRVALALFHAVRRVGIASIALTGALYFCSSLMFSHCCLLPPKPI